MSKEKTVKVRVLVDQFIDGAPYKCNAVAEVDAKQAKLLVAQGSVDDTPEAVAYAESLAG